MKIDLNKLIVNFNLIYGRYCLISQNCCACLLLESLRLVTTVNLWKTMIFQTIYYFLKYRELSNLLYSSSAEMWIRTWGAKIRCFQVIFESLSTPMGAQGAENCIDSIAILILWTSILWTSIHWTVCLI